MIEKTYTFNKPSDLMNLSSSLESVTCTYNGPQKIRVVVAQDETISVDCIPLTDDDWEDIEDGMIDDDPDTTDRYMTLNASNDDHIVLMQVLAGETTTENTDPIDEVIGTYTFGDGSTFELKYQEDNPVDPQQIIDAESVRINPEGVISYNFRENDNNNDEDLSHAITRAIQWQSDKADNADTLATTKLYKKHVKVLEWIKNDLLGTVPRHKIILPNVVDVELGGTHREIEV